MNEKTSRRTADDAAIRRLVTELVDDAPSTSDWSQIRQRADRPNFEPTPTQQRSGTSRRGLMLVAAVATVALVGVAAVVATRGGPVDRLVPADSVVASTTTQDVTSTTEAPLLGTVTTAAAIPVEPSPATSESDPVEEVDPAFTDPEFDDEFIGDAIFDDRLPPVDYPEIVLATATNMPTDAWVVAGRLPDGITARFATGDVGRRVAYGDTAGRSIEVATDFQPLGGGETLDVDGIIWSFETFDDTATYIREIGLMTIMVTTVGIDRDDAISVLRDLRAGGDQVLPVGVIQPINMVRLDSDLVATDDDAFRTPATFRARGVNGWYCIEIAFWTGSGSECSFGRNGQLSTEVIAQASSFPEDADADRVVLAGMVAPEVDEVEVVFADGTSDRAVAGDPTGPLDDRFWILEIDVSSNDPFVDRFVGIEVRLLAADGSILGTAPSLT